MVGILQPISSAVWLSVSKYELTNPTWYLMRFVECLIVERDGPTHTNHRVLLLVPVLASGGRVCPAPGGRQHPLGDKLF